MERGQTGDMLLTSCLRSEMNVTAGCAVANVLGYVTFAVGLLVFRRHTTWFSALPRKIVCAAVAEDCSRAIGNRGCHACAAIGKRPDRAASQKGEFTMECAAISR